MAREFTRAEIIDKIKNLRAKAESTPFEAEKESCLNLAKSLQTKHSVSDAEISGGAYRVHGGGSGRVRSGRPSSGRFFDFDFDLDEDFFDAQVAEDFFATYFKEREAASESAAAAAKAAAERNEKIRDEWRKSKAYQVDPDFAFKKEYKFNYEQENWRPDGSPGNHFKGKSQQAKTEFSPEAAALLNDIERLTTFLGSADREEVLKTLPEDMRGRIPTVSSGVLRTTTMHDSELIYHAKQIQIHRNTAKQDLGHATSSGDYLDAWTCANQVSQCNLLLYQILAELDARRIPYRVVNGELLF